MVRGKQGRGDWGGEGRGWGGSQYTLRGVERVWKTKRDEQGLKRRRPVKCEMKIEICEIGKAQNTNPKQNR